MLLAKKQCKGSEDDWQSLESVDMQGRKSKVTSNVCRVKADMKLDHVPGLQAAIFYQPGIYYLRNIYHIWCPMEWKD